MKTNSLISFFLLVVMVGSSTGCSHRASGTEIADSSHFTPKKHYSSGELHKRLTPEQFYVTQEAGTEGSFSGKYWDNHEAGIYACIVCGTPLFDSKTKFESGTGWPSFYQPLSPSVMHEHIDTKLGYERTEIVCATCGAHLGHVFDDGPKPTGLRYCMNSAALNFKKQ